MLRYGFEGQMTIARRHGAAEHLGESGGGPGLRGAREVDRAHLGLSAKLHEVFLESELATARVHARAYRVVAHRQQPRGDAEPATDVVHDRAQRLAGGEPPCALHV